MSLRVTRSSARLAAQASASTTPSATTQSTNPPDVESAPSTSRKRKTTGAVDTATEQSTSVAKASSPRRSKRPRVAAVEPSGLPTPASKGRQQSTQASPQMAKPGFILPENSNWHSLTANSSSANPDVDMETPQGESSKRKSSRNKKSAHGKSSRLSEVVEYQSNKSYRAREYSDSTNIICSTLQKVDSEKGRRRNFQGTWRYSERPE